MLLSGVGADDALPVALPGAAAAFAASGDVVAPGWLPDVLDTLGVSAALELVAAGADAEAPAEAGGVLNALDAGGTLGSPLPAAGAVAFAVELVPVSAGAVAAGLAGVSTLVSLLQATTAVASMAALTVLNQGRVDIAGSTSE